MTKWTNNELNKIGTAEELAIASLRRDNTLRNPVTVSISDRQKQRIAVAKLIS